ncbi:MAG: phosphate/phosphite/phosphonate ABC transporter substrate-binding protein [Nitrospinales bacterium]
MSDLLKVWTKEHFSLLLWCLIFIYVTPSSVIASSLGSKDNPVRMMFVPSGEAKVILKGGRKIGDLLQKETGLYFKTSIATSYAAVIEAMGAGKVDIGWLATFSYVLGKDKYDFDLLLIVVRFGSPFFRGQIVVNSKSGIKTIADLKGKSFAYVDPASSSGHLYPKTLILKEGYNPDKFFSQSVFAGSHNAVILSVLRGDVDGGATYDDARAAVAKSYPEIFDKVRVIAHTTDIPNDTVTARKDLDPVIKEKIKNGLMRLTKTPEGSKVLKQVYGISGLMDFDAFFDPVRDASRLLGMELK